MIVDLQKKSVASEGHCSTAKGRNKLALASGTSPLASRELNAMGPVITENILSSISYYSSFLPVFQEKCLDGITARTETAFSRTGDNPVQATLLAPRIGYQKAWEVADSARRSGKSVIQVVVDLGMMEEEEARAILKPYDGASYREER